jgi:hypothetical protein
MPQGTRSADDIFTFEIDEGALTDSRIRIQKSNHSLSLRNPV